MIVLPYVIAIVAGILNAIHSGTNAQLTTSLERPWWAAVMVCLISGAVVSLGVLVTRESFPSWTSLARTPWWAWVGTAIAGVPVITTLLYAGRLGAAAFNGLVVTATIVASVALDHFGVLGFHVHQASVLRILGAAIMIAGLALICLF